MSVCRIPLILAAAALIATGFTTPASAQTPLPELKLGQRYWVTRTDGAEIRGYLTALTPTDVQVSTNGGLVTIPTADVFRLQKPDGLKNGVLIGAGVGVGLVALSARNDRSGILDGAEAMLLFAGVTGSVGAIAGGLLDWLVGTRKTVYQKASTPTVQVAPTMGQNQRGLRATIRW